MTVQTNTKIPHFARDGRPKKYLALRCHWYPGGLGSRTRHGGDASASCGRSGLRQSRSRLCWRRNRNQSKRLAHFHIELGHGVFVVFEELAGIFAALANALALITEPRARLFEEVAVHRDIEQVAFARNAFSIQNVELGFAERRSHF